MARLGKISKGTSRVYNGMQELTAHEKCRVVSEMSQVLGLMPLLMKPRNKQKRSREDKAQLAQHVKQLSALGPYLMIVLMPGGFFVLPALAWWLHRRWLRDREPVTGA